MIISPNKYHIADNNSTRQSKSSIGILKKKNRDILTQDISLNNSLTSLNTKFKRGNNPNNDVYEYKNPVPAKPKKID
jgi:hypothetical protein